MNTETDTLVAPPVAEVATPAPSPTVAVVDVAPTDGVTETVDLTTPTTKPAKAKTAKARKPSRRKYGTGLLVKRVVLFNGTPVGKGKPSKEHRAGARTVVYIPIQATYDVNVFGAGQKFNKLPQNVKPIKTVDRADYLTKFPKAATLLA